MHLISCPNCGVVLDVEVLDFPYDIYENGEVIQSLVTWHNHEWVPFVKCPACNGAVPQPQS